MSILIEKAYGNCTEMSLTACPACNGQVYEYQDGNWLEWICWKCGHYESNTPAFKAYPHLFSDIVRKNSSYYLVKYARYGRRIPKSQ